MGRGQGGGGRGGGGVTVMTEDEFAYAYAIETDHSFLRSMNFRNKAKTKRIFDQYNAQVTQKYREVAEGRVIYRRLVAEGKMRAPTRLEKLRKTAHGHPDNASTQAARKVLKRMGERY